MKKQLFIFVFLAFFAGIINVNAQNCTPGPLSPVAGQPYDYSVVIESSGGYLGTGLYTWYVTTSTNLLDPAGIVDDNGTMFTTVGASYNAPTSGLNPFSLTWTTAAITSGSTFYLVVKYAEQASGNSCTAMNMKVWEIKPINKFLLAIQSFAGTVGQDGVYCFAPITGAVVSGTPSTVQYTYGENTIYAMVTPSFYAGDWTPSFRVGTMTGDQVVSSVTWDTSPTGTFLNTTNMTSAAGVYTATATGNAGYPTSSYDGSTKLYVKIVIANNNYEGLANQTINIAVDGVIPGATPLPDVVSETDCTPAPVFHKNVDQTIKARPTINDDGTNTFIPKNP